MNFLVIARDGTDSEASQRRLAAREAHLELGNQMKATGELLYAAAILNDEGAMVGSNMVVEFSSREALDSWLEKEPYVVGNVWQDIEVLTCQVGPAFKNLS